ncbi:hypothetical protein BDF21DRAFT_450112 [Thamnidium elegans]|nr:hypothetical protein BDF21DRAFT_450112 [Thamnidium elegans]
MRTIRGLQITSIVVLSPVLLILISLISILLISIYSQLVSIVSTQSLVRTSADIIILQQHQRTFNNKQAKRFRYFPKLRPSPLTWFAVIIAYALYILLKKTRDKKKQQIEQVEIEPITIKSTKKRSKRRKVLKKAHQKSVKKRERSISISSSIEETVNTPDIGEDEAEWTSVATKKIVNKHCFPSCTTTTPKFDKAKADLHLPSPEITPIQSEDELLPSSPLERHNWYSPFITGLDLDIIPKLPQDPFLFTTNHFKTTIPDIHQQQSRIKLLEIHPFIPSPPSSIHTHHAYGTIGDKRKINNCATSN